MEMSITREVTAMQRLTVKQLRQRYAEVFGEETPAQNKPWLIKRIAWRLQAIAHGYLSERARQRAAEIANDADLRMSPPKIREADLPSPQTTNKTIHFPLNGRVPPPGTILTRNYKGDTLQVLVLADGFEYGGNVYASLSAVAKAITGSHCNGFLFFRLNKSGDSR